MPAGASAKRDAHARHQRAGAALSLDAWGWGPTRVGKAPREKVSNAVTPLKILDARHRNQVDALISRHRRRVAALARVGCYVPGGRFPLPSSLLMTAIPARVAGVHEVVVACPRPEPAVMAAALEAGVTRLLRVGGAHAIGALAYGTETIARV